MPAHPIRRRRHRLYPTSARHVLLFVSFLAMMLGPTLGGSIATARALGETAPTEEAPPPLIEETEETDTRQEVFEETEEPLVEETVEPLAEEPVTITIVKGLCDTPGFDPYAAVTEQDLADNCTEGSTDASFTINDGLGAIQVVATSGSTLETTGAAGAIDITEDVPAGYGEPVVACVSAALGSAGLVAVLGGAISINVDPGDHYTCDWYNVPVPSKAELTIDKWMCPVGYDPAADGADPLVDCREPAPDGISFTLSDTDPTTADVTTATGDELPSAVWFEALAGGDYTIIETMPEGIDDAFIWNCDIEGGLNEIRESALAEGSALNLRIEPGSIVTCNWYNVPADENLVPGTQPPGEGGTVTFVKYWCAEEVDATLDWPVLSDQCTQGGDPAELFVNVPEAGYSETASTAADGTLELADVPYGKLFIEETVPDGYAWPRVFCTDRVTDGMGDFEELVAGAESEAGAFTWQHSAEAEGDLRCIIFNFPGDGNSVTVYKWLCPAGTGYGMSIDDYSAACDQEHLDIPITLTDANGERATTTQANGTEWDDVVPVDGNPDDAVFLAEEIPAGFGEPVIFCQALDQEEWRLYEPENGAFTLDDFGADTPWTVQCNWYNIPGRDTTVDLWKYVCPEGTTYDHDLAWYEENCTGTTDEIQFALTSATGITYAYPASGHIQWTGVPTGAIGLQEYIPDPYGDPVVYCRINGGDWEQYPAGSGYIANETFGFSGDESDYSFECRWYNIPAGPADLTIVRWNCPPAYNLYAWGADPAEDCTEATDGVTFTLGGPATEISAETGSAGDGVVQFTDLEPGPYTVTETVPQGTMEVFVLDCYGQRMGELRPYPLTWGNELSIDIAAGESIECHFYNVPVLEGGALTVIKYECATKTFVSTVDCEIYEDGQAFDLVWWNGDEWEYADTQTTDGVGRTTFSALDPGEYWLDEHDGDWCHLESDGLSDNGNWLNVTAGEETVVYVYNCANTPGKPGKTPTKYPNTGVPPVESVSPRDLRRLAA